MKSLVIAEKPSVARDIARVLGANQKNGGVLEGKKYVGPNAPGSYQPDDDATGSNRIYNSTHKNKLFDFYAQYSKELPSVASRFDVMAGYSYQSYQTQTDNICRASRKRSDRIRP